MKVGFLSEKEKLLASVGLWGMVSFKILAKDKVKGQSEGAGIVNIAEAAETSRRPLEENSASSLWDIRYFFGILKNIICVLFYSLQQWNSRHTESVREYMCVRVFIIVKWLSRKHCINFDLVTFLFCLCLTIADFAHRPYEAFVSLLISIRQHLAWEWGLWSHHLPLCKGRNGSQDSKCYHLTLPCSEKQDFQNPFQSILESSEEGLDRWQCNFHILSTPRQ